MYDALLDALARELGKVEAVELERMSQPRREMADIKADERRVAEQQRAASRRDREAFRAALRESLARGGEVSYDSGDPEQDTKADVLTRYLVRLDYAEAQTLEPEPGRYVYRIRVFWNRLRELAEREGPSRAV